MVTRSSSPFLHQVANGAGVAELAIRITPAPGELKYMERATVVELQDRLTIRNLSGMALEWRQKSIETVHLLPPSDETTSLHWDHSFASRSLQVRPHNQAHDWCASFSPEIAGEMTLKLVRKPFDRIILHIQSDPTHIRSDSTRIQSNPTRTHPIRSYTSNPIANLHTRRL